MENILLNIKKFYFDKLFGYYDYCIEKNMNIIKFNFKF